MPDAFIRRFAVCHDIEAIPCHYFVSVILRRLMSRCQLHAALRHFATPCYYYTFDIITTLFIATMSSFIDYAMIFDRVSPPCRF